MLSLRAQHLKRYKDFAVLLWKYGDRKAVDRAGLSELLPQDPEPGNKTAESGGAVAPAHEPPGGAFITQRPPR